MINIPVTLADANRLLSYVRERKRKAQRGLEKFADDFDEEKGASLTAAYDATSAIERTIMEAIRADTGNNPRKSPVHRDERQGRGR